MARVQHEHDGARLDQLNANLIAALRVSPEGQQGLAAFLDKHDPPWVQAHDAGAGAS